MDFVSDQLACGRRLKCLTVADDFSHEAVQVAVDFSMSGQYVTRMLDQVAQFRGYPLAVRTDNVLTASGLSIASSGPPNYQAVPLPCKPRTSLLIAGMAGGGRSELRFFHDKPPARMGLNLPEISTFHRYVFAGGG